MASAVYGKGIGGFLKKCWHEKPGTATASLIGLVGFGICLYDYQMIKNGPRIPKYKKDYIVVRPDDPIVKEPVRTYPF